MKKSICLIVFACVLACFSSVSCKQNSEDVIQIVYITPIWKGSFPEPLQNPEIGWAYYNTTDKKSYIYDGQKWNVMTQDGKDGTDGKDGETKIVQSDDNNSQNNNNSKGFLIQWKGELAFAPDNPKSGWTYYNSMDKKSYIYDGTTWQIIAQDGKDGTNGNNNFKGYLIQWKGEQVFAPDNPEAGWAYYNSMDKKSYIYDGAIWQIIAQDGKDGEKETIDIGNAESSIKPVADCFYLGESTEEIDGIIYFVQSYASVYSGNPYFYTYYKYYYLDNNIRRVYVYWHDVGRCLDYKYTEFIEHLCPGTSNSWNVYIYNENGHISFSYNYYDGDLSSYNKYYENGKIEYSIRYSDGKESSKYYYTYYDNGIKKSEEYYSGGIITNGYTYYEDGRKKTEEHYSNGIISLSYTYLYYDYKNGNKKVVECYSNEHHEDTYVYYNNSIEKMHIRYNYSDGMMYKFYDKYESGFIHYYYYDGYLYTYPDEKTTSESTSSTVYSSRIEYTKEQGQQLIDSLIASLEE